MTRQPLHDRVFRALLRLFPSEFRGDFGEQMARDFRDQRDDAAASGRPRPLRWLWTVTVLDLLRRAPREHIDVFRRDAVHAVRVLRRHPASTLTAILSLAIGIGLNTAVFSVVHGVLWRDLPFPNSDRLLRIVRTSEEWRAAFGSTTRPVIAGRFFEPDDVVAGAPSVAIVNQTAASLFWGDGNPIGKYVVINKKTQLQVVGVVANLRGGQLEPEPGPAMYQPHVQSQNFYAGTMIIRTDRDPEQLLPAIRTIFRAIDPEQPFRGIEPLQNRIDQAIAPRRFFLNIVGLFSMLALALAAIGIYGVLAESVAQRVPEIGVRMALGATTSHVLALFLQQGLWIVAFGIGLGLAGAWSLRGAMATLVFGVPTLDLFWSAAASLFIAAATLAACVIPARRAARLDPVSALRLE